MRNLKRALSLALASVMLLGMMVVGTSAASYPDVDSNDNVEAIEVLNAVKVMIGEQGNFNPDSPVNRHQMAVIMAKLVLGNEIADKYVGTHPFTDVASWADKYVAACYENGIVAGISKTTFGGDRPLTAVEAAAFMLRALGYKDLSKGASDWSVPVTAMANQIRLFEGVASNPKEQLNRNQVAQLALNTLKSPVVDLKDGTFTATDGDGKLIISGGSREYIVRSSSKAYAKAIDETEAKGTSASSIGGCTIELGEHLYNGKLKLNNDARDDFGRPARRWEYDGKGIGTYAKTELLRTQYTTEVTGRELYDLLGSEVVNSIARGGRDEYSLVVTIDGITAGDDDAADAGVFNCSSISRNNKAGVGNTGNGVLTQVYVDGVKKKVDIAIINTYLARASEDYDEKKESVDLTVYGLDDKVSDLVKTVNGDMNEPLTVSAEDFVIADVKEKDAFLVTVADGEIKTMQSVEPMSAVEITSFQARKEADFASGNLTTGGKKYSFSSAAEYDNGCLKAYTGTINNNVNLKDTTYDVYLDNYDYVIGVVEVDKPTNYVFITGVDSGNNNLATTTPKANAVFIDGTMKEIVIDRSNSKSFVDEVAKNTGNNHANNSTFNKWCTYSVSSKDVYSLSLVTVDGALGTNPGQTHTTSGQTEINNKHLSIANANSVLVYGNNKSVYLAASVDEIATTAGRTDCIIDGVDSVTTGIDNVDIIPLYNTDAEKAAGDTDSSSITCSEGAYTLYDKNGWIIAMVVIGDDNGKNSELVYIHNGSVAQEYYLGSDGYKWERTAVVDGVEKTLVEVNDTRISMLQNMDQNNWYRVKTNAKDEVTSVDGAYGTVIDNDGSVLNENKTNIGDWGFKLDGTTRTAYATAYNQYVAAVRNSAIDTILYHELFQNVKQPSASEQTLYVKGDATTNSGVRFAEDVKVVLDQENDNKRETFFGSGEPTLKKYIKALHPKTYDAQGKALTYDYEISAVIEGPYATTIIIKDRVEDKYTPTPVGPGNEKPDVDGLPFNTTIATVNAELAKGHDVVIEAGSLGWRPSDLAAGNDTVMLQPGTHLYIDGPLNIDNAGPAGGMIVMGPADSKLTVTDRLTIRNTLLDGFLGKATVGGLTLVSGTAELNGKMDITGIAGTSPAGDELIVTAGTLKIDEDMTIRDNTQTGNKAMASGAGNVTVNAHVEIYGDWVITGATTGTTITKYNTLKATKIGDGTSDVIITLGNNAAAQNGKYDATLDKVKVIYKNVNPSGSTAFETINVPADVTVVAEQPVKLGNVAKDSTVVAKAAVEITGTLATDNIAWAQNVEVKLAATATVTGDATTVIKAPNGANVNGTVGGTGVTLNTTAAGATSETAKTAGGDTTTSVTAGPAVTEETPANTTLPFKLEAATTAEVKAQLSGISDSAVQEVVITESNGKYNIQVKKALNSEETVISSLYDPSDAPSNYAILLKLTGVSKIYQYKEDWKVNGQGIWVERTVPSDGWFFVHGDNRAPEYKFALVATATENKGTFAGQEWTAYTVTKANELPFTISFTGATTYELPDISE